MVITNIYEWSPRVRYNRVRLYTKLSALMKQRVIHDADEKRKD